MGKVEHLEGLCSLACITITKAILPPKILEEDCGASMFSDQLCLELFWQKSRYMEARGI